MSKNRFRSIIQQQLQWYPEMEIQDLYKLVYQGVMGSGHAISSEESAQSWLREELHSNSCETGIGELCEDISPDGRVLRINLRPYMEAGRNTDRLLKAFMRTGREYRGSNEELVFWWEFLSNIQSKFSSAEMTRYIEDREREYFPAVHHSKHYRTLYNPFYRVTLREICLEEGVLKEEDLVFRGK